MRRRIVFLLISLGVVTSYAEVRPVADHTWIQSRQLLPQEHKKAFHEFRKQGYRPYWMHVQVAEGKTVISTAYIRDGSPGWMALYGLSPCDLRAKMKEQVRQGRKIIHLQKYEDDGAVRYTAIWNQSEP